MTRTRATTAASEAPAKTGGEPALPPAEVRAAVREGQTVQAYGVTISGQRVTDGVVEWKVGRDWKPRWEVEAGSAS